MIAHSGHVDSPDRVADKDACARPYGQRGTPGHDLEKMVVDAGRRLHVLLMHADSGLVRARHAGHVLVASLKYALDLRFRRIRVEIPPDQGGHDTGRGRG